MADNLIFPVKFDLEAAVRKAQGDADKYLRQLQTTIHSKPLAIDLKIVNAGSGSLNEINKRMRDIVAEWNNMSEAERIASKTSGEYTDRAKKLIAEFARLTGASETYARSLQQIVAASRRAANEQEKAMEKQRKTQAILLANEKSIASITAKLKYWKDVMNNSDMGGKRFRKAAEEVRRLNQSLGEAQRNVNSLTGQFKKQDGYVSRLVKRLVVYAGFQQISNFLTSVRSVTTEFELQRISLGAIIQDQAKANALFSEIKNFALKSPIKILDLTKYTKQLAAYKIGVNELFDTTKRLADISVGLGVSMDRLILLYGQVRATGYLRACLGAGTRVKMYDGSYKNVEDVVVGDMLIGDDEKPRHISKLYQGEQQMYRVRYDGGEYRCNEHHILTVYDAFSERISDVFVLDYLKEPLRYQGVRRINGEYKAFLMKVEKDVVDTYYGFSIDGNHRFIIEDNIVTHNTEIRQATEAGIPLVEELANKLSEANGTLVTSAQVLKMVEERAISFEMVKEVFEDMTNAGGLFYDMQEKQGNTLYGMWQKLGDAAAMMYDEIGNTPWVNEGMKEAINMLRTLMIEWKRAGANIATLGVAILLYANKTKLATLATKLNTAANTEGSTALRGRILHLKKAIMYQNLFATSTTTATTATKLFALAQLRLTQALNLVVVGFKKLSAAFMSNIWGIALVGLSLLIEHLIFAKDQAKELKNELANINLDYESKQGQDAANLEYLANAAVNAAKGSKAQKDALEELKNTYGKIIPMELLTIENLERMKGNYGELIALIDEYNLKQKYEKETSAIESSFAPKEEERANKIRNILRDGLRLDYADEATGGVFDKVLDLSERNIQRFLLNLKKYADEGLDKKEQIIRASADLAAELGLNEGETEALTNAMIDLDRHELEGQGTLMDYTEALHQKHEAMEEVTNDYEKQKKALNEYSAVVDEVLKKNEEEPEVTANKDEFENEKARLNNQISDVASGIVELLNKANVAVDNGTQQILNTVIQNGGMIPDAVWDILEKAAEAANNPKLLAAIQDLREHYKGLAPDNQTVNFIKDRMVQIVSTTGLKMKEFRQYLWDGQGDIKTYQENLQKSINTLRAQAFEMIRLNALIDEGLAKGQKYDVKEIQTLQAKADALQQLLDTSVTPLVMPDEKKSKSRGGTKSDNRLQNLQEIEQTLTKINQKYDELAKKEGQTKALEDINKLYANTLDYVNKLGKQFKLSFKIPTEFKDLQDYRKVILDVINTLKMKGYQKAALDLEEKIGTGNLDALQKDIEKQLKELADRISRTKTAKEFYEKILGQTGNRDMAKRLVTSIFGENGSALNKEIAERMRKMVEGTSATLPDFVFNADMSVNSKALRGWVEANKAALGDVAKELTKFADDAEKDTAKMVEGWLKATEKAKTYGDKLADVYRTTATEIARIEAEMAKGNLGRDIGTELIAGYRRKEAEEVAKLQYEAFKDSPMYVQMFDDLDHASTAMLENMKTRIKGMKGAWKDLTPTQLKELQSRMNEIDAQLAKRNPFKVMADGLREYTRLRTKGDARGNTSRANADRDATEWAEKYLEAQEELAKITNNPTATEAQIAGARQMVDYTKRQKDEAEKTAANWKKVEDAIGLSANQLMQMLNWGGDIAHAIADISEAMGADEEDVQYWNDIASGLDEVSGAIQDIVSAAMSANVVGVISSALTAIPKMFVGFANIFSAGKVKRANKEIKRQQELIEALEYSYSRLEKTAEKTFGADYLRNVNERLRMLKAEAEAYRKQAEAERSKGKKRDKEAEKEYLEHARDTADEIEELNRELQEKITGTTVEKAAEDFANAWLDAYLSFGNTAEAIKEKFRDMMKTMVVNMALSGVVERMLKPLMKMIDERAADGELSSREIAEIMGAVPGYVDDIDNAMTVAMEALKAAGVDVGQLRDATDAETRGIAKGVASATSEEINAATAVGKTLLYYASPIPRIDENLARVVAIMESRGIASPTASGTTTGAVDYTGMFNTANQHLSSLPRMEQHLAEIHTMLGRALKTKGSTTGINTFLN